MTGKRYPVASEVVCAGWALCLIVGCASGGGGGGGSGESKVETDCETESGPDCLEVRGCTDQAPQTAGANPLPNYDLLPGAIVPKLVREAESHPEVVDLAPFLPTPCNQGTLNSCVGWAAGYAMMTYLAARNIDGWDDLDRTDRHFSPTFIFNQVNAHRLQKSRFDNCMEAGTFLTDALTLLRDSGCVTWSVVPYTVTDCQTMPSAGARTSASDYRLAEFTNLPNPDEASVKSYLAAGIPVFVRFAIGTAFQALAAGQLYDVIEQSEGMSHAVLAVGYSDDVGGFKIINSWGTTWGDDGFGMISYDVWSTITEEAWVPDPELVTTVTSVSDEGVSKLGPGGQEVHTATLCTRNPMQDTDGDGYIDSVEEIFADFGFDPLVVNDNPDLIELPDADGDGWPDETETVFGTLLDDPEDFPFDCDYEYPEGFFDEFINPPTGTTTLFGAPASLPVGGAGPFKIVVGDLNGDGSPDLAVANRPAGEPEDHLAVFLNDGAGGFGAPVDTLAGATVTISGPADLDGDGDQDILTASRLLLNNGDGTFEVILSPTPVGLVRAVGDFDGDGDVDLVGEFPQSQEVSVALNNGDATFGAGTLVGTLAGAMRNVLPVDLDGDGDLDLVVSSQPAARIPGSILVNLSILINNGDATFAPPAEFQIGDAGEEIGTPTAADLDGDGDPDLVLPRPSAGLVTVLFNEGAPSFGSAMGVVALESGSLGFGPAFATAGDFDGDGDTDLSVVVARASTGTGETAPATTELVILLNQGDGTSWVTEQTSIGPAEPTEPVNLAGSLAAADLDGDGDADLAAESITSDEVFLLFNEPADTDNGDGTPGGAADAESSIVAWGDNSSGQTDPPPGADFVAVAAGGWHSLALKNDGSIIAWGAD